MTESVKTTHDAGQGAGVFGRGPMFWAGMMLASLGAIAGLGLSGAVEGDAALFLLIVPAGLLLVMFLSAYHRADTPDPSCSAKDEAQKRPVIIWFVIFLAFLGAMILAVDYWDIGNPLIANGLIVLSMIFLAKAGLNSMANAGRNGAPGAPARTYLMRMLVVSFAYVGSLFAASSLIEDGDPVTVLSVLIAIVPGLAVAGYFWAIGRYVREQQDEFLRMLMVRQSLIATGLTFSAASIWGFLESFGQVGHLDAYWWPILWFFGIGIGALVNRIEHGTWGEA